MTKYNWSHPERRDLFLAASVLASTQRDGDWLQWASDTLIQDLELYDDFAQGAGSWLTPDEEELAKELGEQLWGVVKSDPFSAAELLSEPGSSLAVAARKLAERLLANGREVA